MSKRKILILVEGAKTDFRLVKHLLDVYELDEQYEIVSYNTNIYALYNTMFKNVDPAEISLLEHLREHEPNPVKKQIFNEKYSDILLVFDFDPHDYEFSDEKILEMSGYFVESTDMGKLYLNYPMAESFYHMKSIPDYDYNSYTASIMELKDGLYKRRVNAESCNRDYRKFAVMKRECNIVIRQNVEKAWLLVGKTNEFHDNNPGVPTLKDILLKQLELLHSEKTVAVLCTSAFYIIDYNPKLVLSESDS